MTTFEYNEQWSRWKGAKVLVAIGSSMELRSKKELIQQFIATVNTDTDVNADWRTFIVAQKEADFKELVKAENLNEKEARAFIDNSFRDGEIKTIGTDLGKIMPPVSRFRGGRSEKKKGLIAKLKAFFNKYDGLGILELEKEEREATIKMVADDREPYNS